MALPGEQNIGAIIRLTPPDEGDIVWNAEQTDLGRNPTPFPGDPKIRIPFKWSWGPVSVEGYIDTGSFAASISIVVMGISLGTVSGNLKDGIEVKVDLFVVKGALKFYLKNGNELWINVSLKVIIDGEYNGDFKIISF